MTPRPPRLVRRLAALLMRGNESDFILADLDEAFDRDLERGLSPARARRRYIVNVLDSVRNTWIDQIRLGTLAVSSLDLKLGLRMLLKNPVLTVVTISTLGIGIPSSLIPLQVTRLLKSDLPFEQGDRIVALQNRDLTTSRPRRASLHDLRLWRESILSVEQISAAKLAEYNVGSEDGRASPVRGAEITASVFEVTRTPPLMGRTLLPEDEISGAAAVVVLSEDLWRSRFAGDADIVGSTVDIGRVPHTVVGIMPHGFLFPRDEHVWLPLRDDPLDYERGGGPGLLAFGRLADGTSLADARVELETLGAGIQSDRSDTHGQLRPEVDRYTAMMMQLSTRTMMPFYLAQLITFLLLAVACGSVGTLFFARTANRAGELAVRTALGASRLRVVGQLFSEALLIALIAVSLGLGLTQQIAPRVIAGLGESLPFWIDTGVNRDLVLLSLPVAVIAAVMAGVLPALKLTGKGVLRGLQRSGSGASIRFGRAATVLIVTEIALSVGLLSVGAGVAIQLTRLDYEGLGIDPQGYLYASLVVPWVPPKTEEDQSGEYMSDFQRRTGEIQRELHERLSAEPGVRRVAWGLNLPAQFHFSSEIEVEGRVSAAEGERLRARRAMVHVDFFRSLDAPVLQGRDFDLTDAEERRSIIVNTGFVRRVLRGADPIGQRVRYRRPAGAEPGPWLEIVGVVGSLGTNITNPGQDEAIYEPFSMGQTSSIRLGVQLSDDPGAFTPRLRELTAQIAPNALIRNPRTLEWVIWRAYSDSRMLSMFAGLVSVISLVLSAAGLYAIMSFTVTQRTREIGIRSALGAGRFRIIRTILSRALWQLFVGIAAGVVLITLLVFTAFSDSEMDQVPWFTTVTAIALLMTSIGLVACLKPALRGVRIQPTEALREG